MVVLILRLTCEPILKHESVVTAHHILPKGRHATVIQELTTGASEIFRIHLGIRWTSLVTKKGDIIFSQTRPGIKSLVSEEGIATFIEANRPKSILEACENLSMWAGNVNAALIEYEKIVLYIATIENNVLAISCEKTTSYQEISEIANKLQACIRDVD